MVKITRKMQYNLAIRSGHASLVLNAGRWKTPLRFAAYVKISTWFAKRLSNGTVASFSGSLELEVN